MIRSLVPLVGLIVVFVLVWQPRGDKVPPADPASDITAAAEVADYQVVVPRDLPSGWTANHSTLTAPSGGPVSLEIGYVTAAGDYARFVESDQDEPGLVTSAVDQASPDGSAPVAGQTWARYRTARDEVVLTHTDGTVTLLVTGSADTAELVTLAAAL